MLPRIYIAESNTQLPKVRRESRLHLPAKALMPDTVLKDSTSRRLFAQSVTCSLRPSTNANLYFSSAASFSAFCLSFSCTFQATRLGKLGVTALHLCSVTLLPIAVW